MHAGGAVRMSGMLGLRVERPGPVLHPTMSGKPSIRQALALGLPSYDLAPEVSDWRARNFRHLMRSLRHIWRTQRAGCTTMLGSLYLTKIDREGRATFLGLASARVVTTVGVGYIVDAFQNSVELENMKYHGVGEQDSPGEAVGDTDLEAEITTEYGTNNTRATGTTTEGAGANVYRTVGTNTFDGDVALVEHGIFSSATVGAGVLLDRSVFAVVNLSSGESLQSTYDLSLTAGG